MKQVKKISTLTILAMCILLVVNCGGGGSSEPPVVGKPEASPSPDVGLQHLAAGDATVDVSNANAFSKHSKNLKATERIIQFNLGNDFFENPWIAGNASTSSRDGLGGLFNNNACQDCHIRDGRGHAPSIEVSTAESGHDFSSILFKAVRTNISDEQRAMMSQSKIANVADTSVGSQVQHDAIEGVKKEARLGVSYQYRSIAFDDGFTLELRKPMWQFQSNYADEGHDFNADTVFSARVAPPMIGLGLLALIPEMRVLENEDIEDKNQDGISGKANYVWSSERQRVELGRFGWKAGQPTVLQQTAGAFLNDMGLTSRLNTTETCVSHQLDCLNSDNGNGDSVRDYDYEVADKVLDAVTFYASHLGVPERRNAYNKDVQEGKALFKRLGCADCHVESYTTEFSAQHPELSEQRIFPYTDLLVHDMGPQLADIDMQNNPVDTSTAVEFLSTGSEWRTPPLWGLGLTKSVDPDATFLHDGRARTIMEAVLWHGGEAEAAKQRVLQLNSAFCN